MPALSPIELWEQSGRAAQVRERRAAGDGARRARRALRARGHPRGGRDHDGRRRGRLVPPAAAHRVPDPDEVPRRGAPALRPSARPRVPHVRRVLLRRRQGRHGRLLRRRAMAAYLRIFERLGLAVTPVEALSGAIGGDVNHEFMVDVGHRRGPLRALREAAATPRTSRPPGRRRARARRHRRRRAARLVASTTPGATDDRRRSSRCSTTPRSTRRRTLKSIAAIDDDGAPVRRARRPATARRSCRAAGGSSTTRTSLTHPALLRGYLGPVGLDVRVVADASVAAADHAWVVGANEPDAHLVGVGPRSGLRGRRRRRLRRCAREGDRCPRLRRRRSSSSARSRRRTSSSSASPTPPSRAPT